MARFVNHEEFEKTGSHPSGRGHFVRRLLMSMQVGQILKVTRAEWNWKGRTPNVLVKDVQKKTDKRFEFSNTGDFKGWFIRRVE